MPARRRPRTFAPAMMAGAVLLLAAVPARAQDAHGAIAFGQIAQDPAVAYGVAWDYPTRDEAQEAAMNVCLDNGGSDCTVLAWFMNSCGALAMDQYGMAQGKGARTLEQAEARALQTCETAGGVGCAVVGSQCVSSSGQPDTWSGSESVLFAPEETAGPTDPIVGPAADPDRPATEAPRSESVLAAPERSGTEQGEEGSGPTAGETADGDRPATEAPRDEGLTPEERMQVQQGLAALGFDAGPADGMFGLRTRAAIWEWQQAKGLEATGYLSREETEVLAAVGAESREQAASRETAEPDGSGNQVVYFAAAGPKCAELGSNLGERDGCWEEIPSQPGCFVWTDSYLSHRSEDWTGGCAGDTAHGRGSWSSVSVRSGDTVTDTGAFMHGKRNGHWVTRWADGSVSEGPYLDGERHGRWVSRLANGMVSEGPYVLGEPNGHWVTRWADGGVSEGPYVDGKRNGNWVSRMADGTVWEGPYVDGEWTGRWVIHWADGNVWEGPYVDGNMNGHWVERFANGGVSEGPYVDGKRHGNWVSRRADGTVIVEREWRNGEIVKTIWGSAARS